MSWVNGHWKSSADLGTSGAIQKENFGSLKAYWESHADKKAYIYF